MGMVIGWKIPGSLALGVVLLLHPGQIVASPDEPPLLLQKVVSWHSEDGASEGLHLVHVGREVLEMRLFVVPIDGDSLVYSTRLSSRSGRLVAIVQDDKTGWWAKLDIDFGVRAETLDQFFRAGYESETTDADSKLALSLVTSTGVRWDRETEFSTGRELIRALASDGMVAGLAESIPSGLHQPLLMLAGSLADVQGTVEMGPVTMPTDNPLIEILSGALEMSHEDARELRVPMLLEGFDKGPALVSPRARQILRKFRATDPAKPMRPSMHEPSDDAGS